MCLLNTIDSIEKYCNQLCTSVNIPTGWSRMHMDTPISTVVKTNSFLAEKEGFELLAPCPIQTF